MILFLSTIDEEKNTVIIYAKNFARSDSNGKEHSGYLEHYQRK